MSNIATEKLKFFARIEDDFLYLEEKLSEFANRFSLDPAYSLAKSDDVFKTAAELHVLKWLNSVYVSVNLENITDEEKIAKISDVVMFEIGNRVTQVENSTSRTSNLMNDYLRMAWARVAFGMNKMI